MFFNAHYKRAIVTNTLYNVCLEAVVRIIIFIIQLYKLIFSYFKYKRIVFKYILKYIMKLLR